MRRIRVDVATDGSTVVRMPGLPGGPRPRLGRLLVSRGLLNIHQLAQAVQIQRSGLTVSGLEPGARLGTVLLRLGYVQPMHLVRALCDQAGRVNFLAFGEFLVEPPLARAIPRSMARDLGILPLVSLAAEHYLIATPTPPITLTVTRLERTLRGRVEPIIVREREFPATIDACYDELERRGTTPVRLGEILVRDGLVAADRMTEALAEARRVGRPIGEVLVEWKLVDERFIYVVLARQRGLRLVSAREAVDLREAAPYVARLSRPYVRHCQVVPYRRVGRTVFAVTSDPNLDTAPLAAVLDCETITLQLACRSEMAELVEEVCRLAG